MEVPGQVGHYLLGDETIEFARSPRDYIERRRATHGAVFAGRVLNKPTIFLTSSAAVHGLLSGEPVATADPCW